MTLVLCHRGSQGFVVKLRRKMTWILDTFEKVPVRKMCNFLRCVTLRTIFIFTITTRAQPMPQIDRVNEVCHNEALEIMCPSGEMILMTSAFYGRMALNRCVKVDLFLGCYTNVLKYLDKECSGRNTCYIPYVARVLPEDNPCSEMARYLKIEHRCIAVASSGCSTKSPALITAPSGYLFNSEVEDIGCGGYFLPYEIRVQQWQKINITLIDFTARGSVVGGQVTVCVEYAMIEDPQTKQIKSVCSGIHRQTLIYSSKSNIIQLGLKSPQTIGNAHFALFYEVAGCPEPRVGSDTQTTFKDDMLLIKCNNSPLEWQLRCQHNSWQGNVGNCSQDSSATNEFTDNQGRRSQWLSSGVVVALIASVAIVITLGILVWGVVCWKRYHPSPSQTGSRLHQMRHHAENPSTYIDAGAPGAKSVDFVSVPPEIDPY